MRLLALYIAQFRVTSERQRRPELNELPCIIYRGTLRPVVVEACAQATRDGVEEGMLLSRALSRCPQAVALAEDLACYQQAQKRLIRMAWNITPDVAEVALGLLHIQPKGLERLVGDERAVGQRLLADAQRLGYEAKVAVASTSLLAETLAHYGREALYLVPDGKEQELLRRIPLRLLPELDPSWRKMKRKLERLGQHTWLDVLHLGRAALQAQFGKTGLVLWQMLNGQSEAFVPLPAEALLKARHSFDFPECRQEVIDAALWEMASRLATQLAHQRQVCVALSLSWQGRGSEPHQQQRALKAPVVSPEVLVALASQFLLTSMDAPLETLCLRLTSAPITGHQLNILLGKQSSTKLERLAEHLQQRLGAPMLMRAHFQAANHLEELTYVLRPVAG